MTDWPLQNICEPHETNDVLLWKKTKTISAQYFSPTEDEPQGSNSYEGNQRFLELLRARQDDYKLKSSMEKPLVSLELLKQWRTQVPPGRFLIATHSSTGSAPPLWKDVGDKEARSRISKALKQLSSNSTSVSRESSTDSAGETKSDDGGPNTAMSVDSATICTASPTTSATASLEDNHDPDNNNNNASNNPASGLAFGKERTISDRPVPRSIPRHQPGPEPLPQPAPTILPPPPKRPSNVLPAFPRITKPSKLGGRRISAQLQKANKQGRIYGRWDERDQLLSILKGQIRSKQRPGSRCNKRLNSSLSETSSGTGSNTNNSGNTAAAQDRKVDLVLIRGPLGVGKTSLARTLKNPLALTDDDDQQPDLDSRPSFFLEAKFEQLMNPNPYKAFLDVFNDFCHQLLRGSGEIHHPSPASDDNGLLVEQCRDAILDAFQEDVDVLLKLIPALEPIVYPCCETSGQSNSNRPGSLETKSNSSGALMTQKVKGYFVLLLQTIASLIPQYPVVVLFNDIHWASEISLDILTTLIADVGHSSTSGATTTANRAGIIFVGSICDCQDAKPYFKPAMQFLANRRTVELHNIVVDNLKEGDVRDFLVDTLDCTYEKVLELAPMMYRLSKGNPMILHEFLRKMQDHGFLYTDEATGEWTFDLAHMQCQFQQARTFPEMLRIKLDRFSKEVRKTVMYAACLGSSTIDTTLLGLVDPDNYASHLEQMAEVGMLRKRDGLYQFSIDGVQHKLYSMIPAEERASYHLCIAQKLWQHLDERKDKEFLFILLNQLMLGDTQVKADDDRRAVAGLCLRAGELAAKTLGFHTAWVYLEHGIQILPQGDKLWGRENYDLSLRLHNAACEVCYANAQWDTVDDLVEAVLEHGRVFDDTLIARSTQIYALGSRHRLDEAVDVALDTLNQLGEWFPSQPAAVCVAAYFRRTKAMLRGKTDKDIMQLKPMTEKGVLAKMLILNHSFLYAYHARPHLAGLISLRMVELTIKHGISDLASVAFCFYAMLLVSVPDVEEGLRYGKLGLKLYEKFRNEAWLCRVWSVYYGIVSIAKDPVLSTLEPLRHAKRVGLRTGDIEFAMFSGMMYLHNAGHSLQLPMLKEEIRKLTTEMAQTGHTLALAMIQPITNCISKLTAGPRELQEGREASSEGLKACSNDVADLWMQYSTMSTAFMYGDFDMALKHSKGLHHLYTKHGNVSTAAGLVLFFECMAKLAHAKKNRMGYLRYMPYVKRRLRMMQEWTFLGNENLLGKFLFLKAEIAAVRGNLRKACLHCRSGILHSREQRQLGIEAFGNEKLAMYLLEMGKSDEAIPYLDESCRVYEFWGAKGKVEQLRKFRLSLLQN